MTTPAARRSFFARVLGAVGLERSPRPRASVYRGVRPGRLTQDYFTQILSGDQEIKSDFRRLRGVARALVRDNSFASRYVRMLSENVVGPHGIRLQARAITTRGNLHSTLNDKIEEAWAEWGRPENASVDGRMSWADIQKFAVENRAQDGEVLIRIIRGANNAFGFALQILDPDQLDDQYNLLPAGPGNNEIRMGVEIDPFGKPVQYWVWKSHPNDPRRGQERVPIPAGDIIHLFRQRRPGQTRGVTDFAPVMFDQQMLQGYQEAEITAARTGASNMAAVEYDPTKGGDGGDDDDLREGGDIPLEIEPGIMLRLNPGEKLVNTNFNHPNGAFPAFTKAIQRSIASGLNVSYSSLTGDLEAVNFSSIKAGLLGERDFYRDEQVWYIDQLCARVYREWAPFGALAGYFSASEARGTERILWQPRGWKSPDPLGDAQAAILKRRAGLTTLTAVCGEEGTDFEENLEQIAEENKLALEYGVAITLDTTVRASPPPNENDDKVPPAESQAPPEAAPEDPRRLAAEAALAESVQDLESRLATMHAQAAERSDIDRSLRAAMARVEEPYVAALEQTRAAINGLSRVVEQQAKAITAAAQPVPQAPINITTPDVSVTITNETKAAAPRSATARRLDDGTLAFTIDAAPVETTDTPAHAGKEA